MADHTTADEIAEIFQEQAAPIFADAFHADTYVLVALDKTNDGRGGRTPVEKIVEGPRRCSLSAPQQKGVIRFIGQEVIASEAPYAAELPRDSIVTKDHIVRINGRDFYPASPPRLGGEFDLFVVIDLETRS
ncbi:MAG: hypothetical protein WBA46_17170 [Thermomicrobiales bacterium]